MTYAETYTPESAMAQIEYLQHIMFRENLTPRQVSYYLTEINLLGAIANLSDWNQA